MTTVTRLKQHIVDLFGPDAAQLDALAAQAKATAGKGVPSGNADRGMLSKEAGHFRDHANAEDPAILVSLVSGHSKLPSSSNPAC